MIKIFLSTLLLQFLLSIPLIAGKDSEKKKEFINLRAIKKKICTKKRKSAELAKRMRNKKTGNKIHHTIMQFPKANLRTLLSLYPIEYICEVDENGNTPLHIAIQKKNLNACLKIFAGPSRFNSVEPKCDKIIRHLSGLSEREGTDSNLDDILTHYRTKWGEESLELWHVYFTIARKNLASHPAFARSLIAAMNTKNNDGFLPSDLAIVSGGENTLDFLTYLFLFGAPMPNAVQAFNDENINEFLCAVQEHQIKKVDVPVSSVTLEDHCASGADQFYFDLNNSDDAINIARKFYFKERAKAY